MDNITAPALDIMSKSEKQITEGNKYLLTTLFTNLMVVMLARQGE
jgi:hypothetical protein